MCVLYCRLEARASPVGPLGVGTPPETRPGTASATEAEVGTSRPAILMMIHYIVFLLLVHKSCK